MNILTVFKQMSWTARLGIILIALYAFMAVFGPYITPYSETQIVGGEYDPWSAQTWLGTDNLGRDMFSRLIFGARNTIGIALLSTFLAFVIVRCSGR